MSSLCRMAMYFMLLLYATMPNNPIDVMYGIGGAPEGVISAAIAKKL